MRALDSGSARASAGKNREEGRERERGGAVLLLEVEKGREDCSEALWQL